ncbi:PucR C-terminal helix-turn-helix domain-containing protein [Parafrankia irregularis]|uniref:PucR C-terminal helix-turn-helix domain-containing protein n=1 Tax=Parafrankia irregularis TaxID=795642 RepID=A0A0S4QL58_9ACTN|nr:MULTISPECIES: helix-turn-helix domain-containing protein [Parafrankia]MBE3205537.1 helix-turn-helix domain-containing protein [Parafrankia sp. CH37]CUU55564.1 PucR C-terminal helix-turn-helix domain-containing protein [Parafrankia irregularis]
MAVDKAGEVGEASPGSRLGPAAALDRAPSAGVRADEPLAEPPLLPPSLSPATSASFSSSTPVSSTAGPGHVTTPAWQPDSDADGGDGSSAASGERRAAGASGGGPAHARGTTDEVIRRVERASGHLAARAAARMTEVLPWYPGMSARHRADIQLVVQAGISSFVAWCRRPEHARELSGDVFRVAPRELVRAVTFRRLVDLVRVAVEAIEVEVPALAGPEHEQYLLADVLRYSRDIAFAGAVVYARAAEERGAWDARLEALVVDQVVRGDVDRSLPSRAAAVGWRNPPAVTVVVGPAPPTSPEAAVDEVHRRARAAGLEVLAGVHHNRLVMVVGGAFGPAGGDSHAASAAAGGTGAGPADGAAGGSGTSGASGGGAGHGGAETALDAGRALLPSCGPGPVVVGPIAADLTGAPDCARAALAAADVVGAWPAAPRPVSASALLPELALAGDPEARQSLIRKVYLPLQNAGSPLLETAGAYLDYGASLEATARALYLHPNTVRYRLRKAADLCGLDPADHRERFVLHIALVLGRLDGAQPTDRPGPRPRP